MNGSMILFFLIAILAAIIGAIPLGLVNLSVIDASLKNNSQSAVDIALGASLVEIFYALLAILAGANLSPLFEENQKVRYFISFVLLVSGLFFWFKKNKHGVRDKTPKIYGFLKGVFLNIVSFQVLLFWLFVAAILSTKHWLPDTFIEFSFFIAGVWIAKMGVLKGYIFLAQKVENKLQQFSINTNRIIGLILLIVAIVQFVKF